MGGIPYYLSLMDKSLSLAQNIDRLFFGSDSELRNEFSALYRALFPVLFEAISRSECRLLRWRNGFPKTLFSSWLTSALYLSASSILFVSILKLVSKILGSILIPDLIFDFHSVERRLCPSGFQGWCIYSYITVNDKYIPVFRFNDILVMQVAQIYSSCRVCPTIGVNKFVSQFAGIFEYFRFCHM